MKSLVYQSIPATSTTAAIGLGLPFGTPSAYAAATAYSVGNYVLSPSREGVVSAVANWYCIKAGTGKTPAQNPNYWLELDTNGIPVKAVYALLQCAVHPLRWTDDAQTTPTTTVGMLLPPNDAAPLNQIMFGGFSSPGGYLGNVKIINQAAGSIAHVTFYSA